MLHSEVQVLAIVSFENTPKQMNLPSSTACMTEGAADKLSRVHKPAHEDCHAET